jgi:PAS domain S-box-containing protein
MMRVNSIGHPLYVSPSLEDLVGFPAREFEQNPHLYRSIIHPDDQEGYDLILAARYVSVSKTVEAEYRVLCKDGTYRWMFERQTRNDNPAASANSSEETAAGVTSFDSLIFDIQDRKLLEAELRHTQRIDMVGQLAGGVAHDFNNYLTAILGQIKLSLLEVSRGSTTHERLLATEQATLRCAEMTKQLLSLSRKDQLSLKPVSVTQLVDSTAALCHHLLPPAICLSVSHAPGTLHLLGDAGQLQQVLMNLIINSRDAICGVGSIALATKERMVSPEAATATLPAGSYVQIDVTDSGSGISADNLKHIFEPFFTTKSAGQGTGLGLSLVFSIIRNHGGAIDVSSEVGKGTRISMLIPTAKSPAQTPELNGSAIPSVAELDTGDDLLEEPTQHEVLVVEDEPLVRSVIKASLLGSGYGVCEVGDAESGLELLRKFPGRFRLVIIDQSLPGMSGRELVAKLRGLGDSTPLLLTTGMPWFEGAPVTPGDPHEVIVKPFDPIDLISAAYRLCQEQRR